MEEDKTLDQVIELIEAESEARNPLHQRRMELLRVKKSGSHSDYLYQIEQHGQLIDFPSLTLESLISHLFLEQCDQDMGRICQEILAREPGGNLQLLRTEVKRAEGSVWYKGNKLSAKRTDERYCSECDTNSHFLKDCWGPCVHCGRRNHKAADCRRKTAEDNKTEKAKEVRDAKERQKELRRTRKKQKERRRREQSWPKQQILKKKSCPDQDLHSARLTPLLKA